MTTALLEFFKTLPTESDEKVGKILNEICYICL